MNEDKYINHISFLPKRKEYEFIDPVKNESDEVIEITKNENSEKITPEHSEWNQALEYVKKNNLL